MNKRTLKDKETDKRFEEDFVAGTALKHFGIKYLFPWQRLVIENILEAMDPAASEEEDSFCKGRQIVLLPTGAGKSLCFQIPALLAEGPSLVIYPLLALMADQQRRMEEAGIDCLILRGGQTEYEREESFQKLRKGTKIILANPEVLRSQELLERLCRVNISHIAIDEAHCVSEWGDSFRPAYLELGKVIEKINPPVITAFTATASEEVLERVSQVLFNGRARIIRSESDRANIKYYVQKSGAKKKSALYLACREEKPMIIFCGTRSKAEDMALDLNVFLGEGHARFYHAGLTRQEKDDIEKWFYQSEEGILCATCAYGMGVDKKNIRTVIHLHAPETPEAYIQEAGRGGRDGNDSKAILLWSLSDSLAFSRHERKSRLYAMKEFAETSDCRRQVLLDALGAEKAYCHGCDLCNEKEAERLRKEKILMMKGIKKIIFKGGDFLLKQIREKEKACDWEKTLSFIKKAGNFYTEEEIEDEIKERFNLESEKITGRRIWNHSDAREIIAQLMESGKIEKSGLLWKDRLKIRKMEKAGSDISFHRLRYYQHRLLLYRKLRVQGLEAELLLP